MNDFLSEYNIKETIGKGTFSVVKLGINKKTKEKVAIKILKKKKITNKEDVERIEREISILKKLNHINVIKVYKINEDEEKYYIVMEYCENGELFHYIVENQRLEEDEGSFFYYQLINGLEYIHSENIVHRDLKPENLLLGKDNILKIIDFGLSNFCEPDNFLETPCGSPCYASPEMVCGDKYNGHMIDIWSTGIIIFAMLCGYLPFEDPDNDVLFKKILKCKIIYPDYLSDTTIDLMKKILVVDPEKRITLNQIKQHPFYLKGKAIFNKYHHNLVKEVEKVSYTLIKKIKPLKFSKNEECINNMVTSGEVQEHDWEKDNYDILNVSTKNYEYEKTTDKINKLENELYEKKIKNKSIKKEKAISKVQNNSLLKENQPKELDNKEIQLKINSNEINPKDDKNNENKIQDLSNNENNNIKNKEFIFKKLNIGNIKKKNKESPSSSAEKKIINEYDYNNDTKSNLSLLQKLLYNNNYEQDTFYNNKILLLKKNKSKIANLFNIKNFQKNNNNNNNKIPKFDLENYLDLNDKTDYKKNKKHKIENISNSFKSHTISENPEKRKVCELSPINKENDKKEKIKKDQSKNSNCNSSNNIKKYNVRNVKRISSMNKKYNLIKNNSNLIKKYISNIENISNNNKNFLSSNNNIINNISIIKSPLRTSRKASNCFSNQYNMKLNLSRLKSNDNNQEFSTSFNNNNINIINININQLKQMKLNSITNNNINFGTSLSNNLNNTNKNILLSNNDLTPMANSNMNYTNKNNFFNHKKLLISTLTKKIKSPEIKKRNNNINLSAGKFIKIKKAILSRRHKKDEINLKKHNYSNVKYNVSGINHNNSMTNRDNSGNKNKIIPLLGFNNEKNKAIKQSNFTKDLFTLKRKNKNQKMSFEKDILKKKKDNSTQVLSNRLKFKKVKSSKIIREKENKGNISNIIKIKKVKNKYSSENIISKRINSGNKTSSVNNKYNANLINKNKIDSSNILINSYLNYSKFHSKIANKK